MSGDTSFSRRALIFAAATLPFAAYGANATSPGDLATLAQALDSAADAIVKLVAGLGQMISAGDEAYSVVSARLAHKRLLDIDARLGNLTAGSQETLLGAIDAYIASARAGHATSAEWEPVLGAVRDVIQQLVELLNQLQADRSEFVLEPARGALIATLTEKVGVLSRLKFATPPTTGEELTELVAIRTSLAKLREKTVAAIGEMSRYIRSH